MTEGPLVHIHEHSDLDGRDVDLILRFGLTRRRVLDVGAGRGGFVRVARGKGLEAYGLELQPDAVNLWSTLGIQGVVGDGLRSPFRDHTFDVVRMKEVLEHVPEPLQLMREASRLLAPEGIIIAHVPSQFSLLYPIANFWDDYTHVRAFTKHSLSRLVADTPLQLLELVGYTSGRNGLERAIGSVVSKIAPHVYRVVARRLP